MKRKRAMDGHMLRGRSAPVSGGIYTAEEDPIHQLFASHNNEAFGAVKRSEESPYAPFNIPLLPTITRLKRYEAQLRWARTTSWAVSDPSDTGGPTSSCTSICPAAVALAYLQLPRLIWLHVSTCLCIKHC